MNPRTVIKQLSLGLAAHERRIEQPRLQQIANQYLAWRNNQDAMLLDDGSALCQFLRELISHTSQQLEQQRQRHGEFSRRIAQEDGSETDQQTLLLQYAQELGATGRKLRQDKKAFKRWFGFDALADRQARQQSQQERLLALCLRQLGQLAAHILGQASSQNHSKINNQTGTQASSSALQCWQQLALEATVLPLFTHSGNEQIRIEAFSCLALAVASLPRAEQEGALGHAAIQYIYRSALDHRLNIWLQCAALKLLQSLAPANFVTVARKRLQTPQPDDDLFVRRRIVESLLQSAGRGQGDAATDLPSLTQLALHDPSPWVRQGLAQALPGAPDSILLQCLPQLLLHDLEPKVRACAALQLPQLANRGSRQAAHWLQQALTQEQEIFPLRVLLQSAEQCVIACSQHDPQHLALWLDKINAPLHALHQSAHYKVRRWCAQTAETLWLYGSPKPQALIAPLQAAIQRCAPGDYVRLPVEFNAVPAQQLGRILAVLNRHDYGVSLERVGTGGHSGWRLWRGHRFGFRLWRWLHELRHPSTDKRQAFRHTIGRLFRGQVRVPSTIMAEMSETKVPGEPLQLDSEAGWRPYLPLADELISALDEDFSAEPLRIYSAEGITEVRAPKGLLARIKAKTWLSVHFKKLAHLRNWREESQAAPDSYLKQVAALGFKVKFTPHQYAKEWRWGLDPAVGRFFSLPLPLLALGNTGAGMSEHWARFENYFYSAFENSLFDLSLFTLAGLALFVGNHIWQNHTMQRARRAIPLVVGGWGTRGKSGTERIKAALFNALGYSVVSKTTGCEAMFLHGHAYQDLREMFLFRPYDKATIWEQHQLVNMSPKLGCEVFLWECMALTPDFVQLLQRCWMRDDISTITNTIPDHEDLQGPAGINIPQVMTNFIPPKGVLITSEEQMRPILQSAADRLGTRMVGTGWLESGLLPPDVLARFPYQEHPDNIALVLGMARELGIAEDFALKEMADRVVPDLGVLKTYPVALVAGRKLSFVNGMSANERFGCIGNWNRVGFNQLDYEQEPGVFISTVVNNRGDRVARSRVFANILVEDLRADRHFLIGSNLPGLQGYIREAWDAHAKGISLWPGDVAPEQVLQNFARHMRVAYTPAHVQARLQAMCQGQGLQGWENLLENWQDPTGLPTDLQAGLQAIGCQQIDATLASLEQSRLCLQEYLAFAQQLQQAKAGDAQLDQAFRDLLWCWFSRKLVVVEDYYASGDSIIQLLAEQIPPGCDNRVMGIQNIKGTGLGFIYCWQAWDACHLACQQLQSRDPQLAERGLVALSRMQNFGLLSEQHLQQTLAQAKLAANLQNERQQAELANIGNNLQKAMTQVRQRMGTQAASGWLERVCGQVEGLFDAGDAIKRRRKANQIYRDLASMRISHARAALELQDLTQRQKGGWLFKGLQGWRGA